MYAISHTCFTYSYWLVYSGEFGTEGSGSVDVSGVVSHARGLGWSVLGWAWNGDGGSVMNMVDPAWAKDATAKSFTPSGYFNTIYNML